MNFTLECYTMQREEAIENDVTLAWNILHFEKGPHV